MSRVAVTPDLVQWARERAGLAVDQLLARALTYAGFIHLRIAAGR